MNRPTITITDGEGSRPLIDPQDAAGICQALGGFSPLQIAEAALHMDERAARSAYNLAHVLGIADNRNRRA